MAAVARTPLYWLPTAGSLLKSGYYYKVPNNYYSIEDFSFEFYENY